MRRYTVENRSNTSTYYMYDAPIFVFISFGPIGYFYKYTDLRSRFSNEMILGVF